MKLVRKLVRNGIRFVVLTCDKTSRDTGGRIQRIDRIGTGGIDIVIVLQ
jgi:hypothetical protein